MSTIKGELPVNIPETYSEEVRESIAQYIAQLDEKHRIALMIAKEHLGTSFNIVKSVGYTDWKKKHV